MMAPPRSYSSFVDGFYGFLKTEVDKLDRLFLSENSTMSIKFLQQLVSLLRSIHSEINLLVQRLDLPVGDKWFDEYMDQSTRLLEACRILKPAVTNMAPYYRAVRNRILSVITDHRDFDDQLLRQVFHQATRCQQEEMRILERENKDLVARAHALCLYFDPNINDNANAATEPQFNRYNGFLEALHASKTVTTLLLAILLSGLVYFLPETSYFSQGAYEAHEVTGKDFKSSTITLHRSVSNVISRCRDGILAHEMQGIVLAVGALRMTSKVTKEMRVRVREMKRCVKKLKRGAPRIIEELDDFIDEIVDARKMIRTCVFKFS